MKKKNELDEFRIGPFTLLQLMALIAALGIAGAVTWEYFFRGFT